MNNKKILMLVAFIIVIAIAAFLMYGEMTGALTLEAMFQTPMSGGTDLMYEELQFGKNLDIWFMLMLVAFLMIFIKKFEWGVALAVLLSAAAPVSSCISVYRTSTSMRPGTRPCSSVRSYVQ